MNCLGKQIWKNNKNKENISQCVFTYALTENISLDCGQTDRPKDRVAKITKMKN